MRKFYLILATILFFSGCQGVRENPIEKPTEVAAPEKPKFRVIRSSTITSEKPLKHDAYSFETKIQKIQGEEDDSPFPSEISNAILKRDGKFVAKFDGIYHLIANKTRFGEFSFLGDESKQVIISQTILQGGRHWIVSLEPSYKVLFDSNDFEVGRSDFDIVDLNDDGVFEIVMDSIDFAFFEGMKSDLTPHVEVILKYDAKAQEFRPANHEFADFALRDVDDEIVKIDPQDKQKQLSGILKVMLRYIYADQPEKAQKFFEEKYTFDDKEVMRVKITDNLFQSTVYRYILSKTKLKA